MANTRHEGRGNDALAGYRRWLARRAETPTTEDADYERFVAAMSGTSADRNGVAVSGEPGGPASEGVPDGVVYRAYIDQISGRADRRRAEEMVKRELQEREEETLRHARMMGGGLSSSHEHLRSRLEGFGRPGEGGRRV